MMSTRGDAQPAADDRFDRRNSCELSTTSRANGTASGHSRQRYAANGAVFASATGLGAAGSTSLSYRGTWSRYGCSARATTSSVRQPLLGEGRGQPQHDRFGAPAVERREMDGSVGQNPVDPSRRHSTAIAMMPGFFRRPIVAHSATGMARPPSRNDDAAYDWVRLADTVTHMAAGARGVVAAVKATGPRIRGAIRNARTYPKLRRAGDLRLHLGCGQKRLPGFINIDHNYSPATDYVGNIGRLPCPPRSVERIETYHVVEDISVTIVDAVLASWLQMLKPGGVLVIECPDFEADIRELLDGHAERMYSIFGRQRFPGDAHHWGYGADSLRDRLARIGFVDVVSLPATDYHAELEPCLRIEASAP
jgi:predicted SAM-dependent methyltransferase